ncbi:MAG: cytochrome c [Dehalococcoidia bacterium]|jgi:mono/diheme cytochrome c family protein|nr:cytochrome c [Dehalococcoidia bacterium]
MTLAYRLTRFHRRACITVGVVAVILMACEGGSGTDSPFPVEVTDERVAAGEQVYVSNCATCHGDITGPPTLPGTPPHGVDGHTWHHADRHLFQWILDGPPAAQIMPPFRGKLSDGEVYAVLAYIKSGWPDDIRSRQNEMSAQVEKQVVQDGGG